MNIAQLVKQHQQITLPEVIQVYPIQNGLAEVLTYFSIAANSNKHLINEEEKEQIPWYMEDNADMAKKEIHLPQVVFVA